MMQGYLIHDRGWHGKVYGFRWDLYEAIGREHEQAALEAEAKYQGPRLTKSEAFAKRRQQQAAELMRRRANHVRVP